MKDLCFLTFMYFVGTSLLFGQSATVVTPEEAILNGCYTSLDAKHILGDAQILMRTNSQSWKLVDEVKKTILDNKITKLDVTEKVTVYRTTNFHKEIDIIKTGRLSSKAQRLSKEKLDWEQIGPEITSQVPREVRLAFQIIALTRTNMPASQFLSCALSYEVASAFADVGKDVYVYRFKVIPTSPILGLRDCAISGGENQYQIKGGTEIEELSRKRVYDRNAYFGEPWEDFDFNTKKWTSEGRDEIKRKVETIVIDGLVWTAKNVDVEVPNSICFNNDSNNCVTEGRLYTFEGASQACIKLGPGWRLPSDEDWLELTRYYGGAYGDIDNINEPKAYWHLAIGGDTGFGGSHGGKYYNIAGNYNFYDFGAIGYYWSGTRDPNDSGSVMGYTFRGYDKLILREPQTSNAYISCRCVKD